MDNVIKLANDIQERLVNKRELEFIDSISIAMMGMVKLELSLKGELTGKTYMGLIAISGYSYQFYRYSMPQLHQELNVLAEVAASVNKGKFMGDIDTPVISDVNSWVLYLANIINDFTMDHGTDLRDVA